MTADRRPWATRGPQAVRALTRPDIENKEKINQNKQSDLPTYLQNLLFNVKI